MLTNTANPYCCLECGAPLGALLMQHFRKRSIVLGACATEGCTLKHSHQSAECISAEDRTQAALEDICQRHGIQIGVMEFPYTEKAVTK